MPATGPISAKIPSSPYRRYRVEGREPHHDPTTPALSSREIVAFHLARLGLGVTEVHGSTGLRQVVPDGSGVCRAHTLEEEAWPRGAELCALVIWEPDPPFRPTGDGQLPDRTAEHWETGTARIEELLASHGYILTRRERPISPTTDHQVAYLAHLPAQQSDALSPAGGPR
ncbi:hypothetical protein [Streptomyces uncialis]|uniref:hypothetical protein n=1 Tax=Streptomyces uncialis TaxID=1048205 RepID=UPI0037895475